MRNLWILPLAASLLHAQLTPDEARRIAEEAYIFGYPLVLMTLTGKVATNRRVPTQPGVAAAQVNALSHNRQFPIHGFRTVIRPNADTLYSSAWLDLSQEPMVLHVPDMKDRYYLVQLMDGWTDSFFVPGTRTTGNRAGDFAIVGPGWQGRLPKGVQRIDSPTHFVWLLTRIQTNTAADYANVHALQAGFSLKPLSYFDRPYTPPDPGPADPSIDMTTRPPVQVERMTSIEFFRILNEAMVKSPPHKEDGPVMTRLARLGIAPGKPFDPPAALRAAIDEGAEAAKAKIKAGRGPGIPMGGNWTTAKVGVYGTDYLQRAWTAFFGLGANPPEDAVYGNAAVDSEGRPLDGKYRYVLHFEKSQMPPVKAFWSVTMYGPEGYFIENPIGRYAIGDRDPLQYNADGSLDLYIQRDRPEGKESNWLPAPGGPFLLSLRLYWPGEAILKGTWKAPPVKRVE